MPTGVYIRTEEHRRKISKTMTGRERTAEHCANISKAKIGKKSSAETRRKLSAVHKKICENPEERKKRSGSKCSHWKGGVSYERNPPELTDKLRQAIRCRDNFICQFCSKSMKSNHRKLDTHHIDDNRHNNHPNNMITLCNSCHQDTRTDNEIYQRICKNLVKKSKRQNPKGHQIALKIYKQNVKIHHSSEDYQND